MMPQACRPRDRRTSPRRAGPQLENRPARPSASPLLAPKHLVQLDLEPHREAVVQDPLGEDASLQLAVRRREQHLAALCEVQLLDLLLCPLVVGTVADDEL